MIKVEFSKICCLFLFIFTEYMKKDMPSMTPGLQRDMPSVTTYLMLSARQSWSTR